MAQRFDLIVIGSGSGLDVANAIAERGQKVAIVEEGPLGGTCLNRGCIPSKMLIHSADVVETIGRAHLFGVQVKGYTVDFRAIVERVKQAVDGDSARIEQALRHSANPKLFKAPCRFVGHKTVQVGDETLEAERILIASGGRPRIPNIPGLEGSGFITSDEALRLAEQPKVLTIIGGGYIAAELGHFFGTLGTRIQVVQQSPFMVPNEDEEIAARFTEVFRQKYALYASYAAEGVAKKGKEFLVKIRGREDGRTETLRSDQLLVAAGRTPNSDRLAVEKTGVAVDDRGFIVTNEFLETNVKGIYALGDAIGHYLFKHSANLEAQFNYLNLIRPEDQTPVDYSAMPHAIFTSPQIAGVGRTEQELRKKGGDYLVGRYDYIDTGMGHAIEDRTGFVKILVDRSTQKIEGCHIMGTDAATLIHEVIVAMKSGNGSVTNLTQAIHIHPALAEVVQRAAYNFRRP